ncbi:type II toxin-antitoxin system RelE/ParE family toxin [Rhodanobacter umsongensis]
MLRLVELTLVLGMHAAHRAMEVYDQSLELLQTFPFTCCQLIRTTRCCASCWIHPAPPDTQCVTSLGGDSAVMFLAIRHQGEEDYH